jgi:CxxC motif-containing protein
MAVDTRELTCINCPLGCGLQVDVENGVVLEVRGNTCPRGDAYGRTEVSDPRRVVTTSLPVVGGGRMVSAKTVEAVPKDRIADVMRALAGVQVVPPVLIGDVLMSDVAGTGVDVVATKSVLEEGRA